MICKKCINLIPKFLDYDLEGDVLNEFVDHIDVCPECKEELTIEFLVKEGLNSLEAGNSFDLNRELKLRIENSYKQVRLEEHMIWGYYALSGVVAVESFILFLLVAFC